MFLPSRQESAKPRMTASHVPIPAAQSPSCLPGTQAGHACHLRWGHSSSQASPVYDGYELGRPLAYLNVIIRFETD